jgi:AraC family ethanolamine operon transcriptional activator
VRCVFTDFDEFADAIHGLNGRYIPTSRSQHAWWIEPLRIGRLDLQQLQVGAPATFAGDGTAGELTIGIPATEPNSIRIDGQALAANEFILIRRDRPFTCSAADIARWSGVTIPLAFRDHEQFRDAAEWSDARLSETRVRTDTAARRQVGLLIALLCSGNDAINIFDPAAVAAAEEEILIAVSQLLRASDCMVEPNRLGRPPADRERILGRCLEHIRENAGQPVFVSELCRAAGVSERTLCNVFYEFFGVGPLRFLKARQLQEVRAALLAPFSAGQAIAHIAAHLGVWDFHTFSRHYRALYGETPAQTLSQRRRPAEPAPLLGPDLASAQSWMNYALRRFATLSAH